MEFNWDESYSVGVRKFDDQHKKLFSLCDQLNNSVKEGKGRAVLGDILDELQEYTSKHFLAEEIDMLSQGYPDYETHKAEHDKLRLQVREFYNNYYSGNMVLSENVMDFLSDWLKLHIAKTDKKYAPFFSRVV
ncbi:MAG: hemerythrin family protein [Nitrospinae bacterium]|nr:hemerythrin family protein [Nitrospinota bacterium]